MYEFTGMSMKAKGSNDKTKLIFIRQIPVPFFLSFRQHTLVSPFCVKAGLVIQRWDIRRALGCMNTASLLPLSAEHEFTQPRAHLIAQLCRRHQSLVDMMVKNDGRRRHTDYGGKVCVLKTDSVVEKEEEQEKEAEEILC